MRRILVVLLQLVGIAVCAVGFGMAWPWLGVALAGAGLFAVGFQLEREAAEADGAG